MSQTAFRSLASPPSDVISSVRFSPDNQRLLVSAWDSTIRVYDRAENDPDHFQVAHTIPTRAAILSTCWSSIPTTFFSASVDHTITEHTLSSSQSPATRVLSTHTAGANKLAYSAHHNLLLSTSWDTTLHVHALPSGAYIRLQLPEKPFALALTTTRAVIAMADRKVWIYDLAALATLVAQAGSTSSAQGEPLHVEPWQQRESSLKFMTRDLVCMPDGEGFAVSSIDGRCGVEFFEAGKSELTFAFKCHREKIVLGGEEDGEEAEGEEVDVAFPVNALAFHPSHSCFATGGGERSIMLWDPQTKRRIRQYEKLEASVTSLDFSSNGRFLAVGVSPLYDDGREETEPNPSLVKVYVKELDGSETKAKPAKSKKTKGEKA